MSTGLSVTCTEIQIISGYCSKVYCTVHCKARSLLCTVFQLHFHAKQTHVLPHHVTKILGANSIDGCCKKSAGVSWVWVLLLTYWSLSCWQQQGRNSFVTQRGVSQQRTENGRSTYVTMRSCTKYEEHYIMKSLIIYDFQLILYRWLNQGGQNVRDMLYTWGKWEIYTKYWFGNPKRRGHMGDSDVNGG